MATSYRMRMYRRRMFQQRFVIGGIIWFIIGTAIVIGMVLFT